MHSLVYHGYHHAFANTNYAHVHFANEFANMNYAHGHLYSLWESKGRASGLQIWCKFK